jgi:hypothetical protein
MPHPLDAATEKLHRAKTHARALVDEIKTFVNGGAYRVETELDDQTFEQMEFSLNELASLGLGPNTPGFRRTAEGTATVPIFTKETVLVKAYSSGRSGLRQILRRCHYESARADVEASTGAGARALRCQRRA